MEGATGEPRLTGRLLDGRWRVGALLGRGGMSSVYEAVHRNGRMVAIKVLLPGLATSTRARARFLREGYIANRIAHPGIVSVIDDGVTDDGMLFLVMELLAGATLEQHCRAGGGRLPENEVLAVADAVLDILATAHAENVVHRDIKASNIFLTADGTLKLLDFGAARLRERSSALTDTATRDVLGTPGFMAPEQARGRWDEVDARTDLWALGATMFRLLTGRLVHEAETPHEAIIAAAVTPAPSLASIDAGLVSAAPIVDRALALDRRDRWPNAGAMLAAVRPARAALPSCALPCPIAEAANPLATLDESSPSVRGERDQFRSLASERWRRAFTQRQIAARVAIGAVVLVGFSWIAFLRGRSPRASNVPSANAPISRVITPSEAPAVPPSRTLVSTPAPAAGPTPAPRAVHSQHGRRSVAARPSGAAAAPQAVPPAPGAPHADPAAPPAPPAPTRLEDVLDQRI